MVTALNISQHGRMVFQLLSSTPRAIAVYERLGVTISRPMQFYFMEEE